MFLDLPKKILSGQVLAAPFSKIDPDFAISLAISKAQMGQAGNTSWTDSKHDPTYGIMDVNNEQEFGECFATIMAAATEASRILKEEKKAISGIWTYQPQYTEKAISAKV